jgi:hypothetical protein
MAKGKSAGPIKPAVLPTWINLPDAPSLRGYCEKIGFISDALVLQSDLRQSAATFLVRPSTPQPEKAKPCSWSGSFHGEPKVIWPKSAIPAG